MKECLYLQSRCSKEFYEQVKELFSATCNGVPFDYNHWVCKLYSRVAFKGTWTRKEYIGDIVFGDSGEVIVYDGLVDRKLSRLVRKTLSSVGYTITLFPTTPEDALRRHRNWKAHVMDYVSIDFYERAAYSTGITFGEWKGLHRETVRRGYFDLAEIIFKQLLTKKLGWDKAKELAAQHNASEAKLVDRRAFIEWEEGDDDA